MSEEEEEELRREITDILIAMDEIGDKIDALKQYQIELAEDFGLVFDRLEAIDG